MAEPDLTPKQKSRAELNIIEREAMRAKKWALTYFSERHYQNAFLVKIGSKVIRQDTQERIAKARELRNRMKEARVRHKEMI